MSIPKSPDQSALESVITLIYIHNLTYYNLLENTINKVKERSPVCESVGLRVEIYKLAEGVAEVILVLVAGYAIYNGADPLASLAIAAIIIGGWRVVEAVVIIATNLDPKTVSEISDGLEAMDRDDNDD